MKKCNKIQLAKVQQSPHDRIVQNCTLVFKCFTICLEFFQLEGVLNTIVNWLYTQAQYTNRNITYGTKVKK